MTCRGQCFSLVLLQSFGCMDGSTPRYIVLNLHMLLVQHKCLTDVLKSLLKELRK